MNPQSIRLFPDCISLREYVPIDLSIYNQDLHKVDLSSSGAIDEYINAYLKHHNARIAYGGYLEKRAIYERSPSFKKKEITHQRTIHLGIDFWTPSGTAVRAPFDGIVHSFNNNSKVADYGPTIILEHHLNSKHFYTLYGHLNTASIKNIEVGLPVQKGSVFCHLGDASVNGDYAPHLHFQIIKDMQSFKGDYPGVCSQSALEYYRNNCPDPGLFLGF